ncbi:4-coumarate--CoA ligase-like 7 [Triticum aestivum]|uniref:4-coumarate--CoA ligase-like 7 n=1 Tax=Triticum aestivum TaxID=4565 RepID=UPI0008446868|nr:4-coumarate--CoA ligase-like 7 [Triticum aestivum]
MSNAHGGAMDARSGYCATTKSFRSLRPPLPLPPADAPLTFPSFALSLLPSPLPAHPALLDAATGEAVSYPAFLSQVRALAAALRSRALPLPLGHGDVAFVLAPSRLDVPVLYLALLAVGVAVSPANPALTAGELSRLVSLSGASVAFAVSSTAAKLPAGLPTVLLDSPRFRSLLRHNEDRGENESAPPLDAGAVHQSATAAIQYSSGTSGRVKAVALSHQSLIAMAAGLHAQHVRSRKGVERNLMSAPMFHSMGFSSVLNGLAQGRTMVVMTDAAARAGLRGMLEAAERWEVTEITAAPPMVLAITRDRYRLKSLVRVVCGGAPLPTPVAEQFRRRFPHVDLRTGYGSTEAGAVSLMVDRDECSHLGSAGRINHNVEAKIVDIVTGEPLSVGQKGELCLSVGHRRALVRRAEGPQGALHRLHTQIAGREDLEEAAVEPSVQNVIKLVRPSVRSSSVFVAMGKKKTYNIHSNYGVDCGVLNVNVQTLLCPLGTCRRSILFFFRLSLVNSHT